MKRKKRILIVDDDPINVDVLLEILEGENELAVAESGEEALKTIPRFKPDLILLDIMMPGIDGYEVCRRIRSDEKYKTTKIILVSGKSMIEERLQGYEVGADDYITKPFSDDELKAKVQVFLRLKTSEEIDQVKKELLMLFSHETRTPLNGILGMGSLLEGNESLNESAKKHVQLILKCGHRLLDFVNKTLLLCQLKDEFQLKYSKTLLKPQIENALESVRSGIDKKALSVSINIPDDLKLAADWSLLPQVFNFIIDNAVNASYDNGILTIEAHVDDAQCSISFTDNGKGISPEWISRILTILRLKTLCTIRKVKD